jgi:Skp family chaperone for outer membrane proteins
MQVELFKVIMGVNYTSSANVMDLMEKIPQKVRDIEGLKRQYQQKKDQLDAKFRTEMAGIDEKIGKVLKDRADELAAKQAEEKSARDEVKKAQKRLTEAKGLIARTRAKAKKKNQEAADALKWETNQAINAIQREIQEAQQQIRTKEKSIKISV